MRTVISFFSGVAIALAGAAYLHQEPTNPPDNEELSKMYKEDQGDRMPKDGKIDWKVVSPRDEARLTRVKEMYKDGLMTTGNDFYHAAMVLQHAHEPNDFLLSHDLCVLAISKGNKDALWLAAASEDRYLDNSKLPQRFGTQYKSSNGGKFSLSPVLDGIADWHRKLMNCPTLEQAKKREDEINKMFGGGDDKKGTGSTGGGGGR